MIIFKHVLVMERLVNFDMRVCCYFNRHVEKRRVRQLFSLISRLGDGLFWYSLIVILPLIYGMAAVSVSLRMTGAGVSGLIIYKLIKSFTERPRPFVKSDNIVLGTAPLDQYSFPSGHTLHAVSFSLIATHYYPELAWLLLPFASLVAMSRVVLGLHYPTDVLAGAGLGLGLAVLYISII